MELLGYSVDNIYNKNDPPTTTRRPRPQIPAFLKIILDFLWAVCASTRGCVNIWNMQSFRGCAGIQNIKDPLGSGKARFPEGLINQ